jgi:hypothetical protein
MAVELAYGLTIGHSGKALTDLLPLNFNVQSVKEARHEKL